jgi:hypothetical protein
MQENPTFDQFTQVGSQELTEQKAAPISEDMPVVFRDPEDIRNARRKDGIIFFQTLVILTLGGLAFYLFLRKPDLIVAVTTPDGQRVVQLNNREFGQTEAVQLGKERLSNDDKTYLVSEFARLRFGVDRASREKDVERMLRMCIPRTAVNYAKDLKERGVLEREAGESWSAKWTQQSVKVDERDPFTVRVIGTQEITKTISGAIQQETVQYEITFKLTTDGSRADDNFRTGFKVGIVSEQIINNAS